MLAERYCAEPNVIAADLFNEPADATWVHKGEKIDFFTDWPSAASRLGNHVLDICPRWLIVVAGVANKGGQCKDSASNTHCWWGENFIGHATRPVELSDPSKLVLSPHVYGEHERRARLREIERRRHLGRALRRRGGGDGHRRPHRRVGRRVGRPREGPGKHGNPRADGGLPTALPRVHQGEGVGRLLLGAAGQHVQHGLAVQRLAGPLGRQARAPLDVAVDVDPRAAGGMVQLPLPRRRRPRRCRRPRCCRRASPRPSAHPEAWYG